MRVAAREEVPFLQQARGQAIQALAMATVTIASEWRCVAGHEVDHEDPASSESQCSNYRRKMPKSQRLKDGQSGILRSPQYLRYAAEHLRQRRSYKHHICGRNLAQLQVAQFRTNPLEDGCIVGRATREPLVDEHHHVRAVLLDDT